MLIYGGGMDIGNPRPPRDPQPPCWHTAWFWITLWIVLGLVFVSFWSQTFGLDGTVKLLDGITNLVKAARGN